MIGYRAPAIRPARPPIPPPVEGPYPQLSPIVTALGGEHRGAPSAMVDVGDLRVVLDLYINSGTVTGLDVQVLAGPFPEARFRAETDADRAAKSRGIAVEPQVGTPSFDDEVYVDSDEEGRTFARLLGENAREALRSLVRAGLTVHLGREGVTTRLDMPDASSWSARASTELLPRIELLLELARTPPIEWTPRTLARRGKVLVILGWLALLPVALACLVATSRWTPGWELPALAAAIGVLVAFLSRPIAARLVSGDAGSLGRYRSLVALAFIQAPVVCVALALTLNGALDAGPIVERRGRIAAIENHDEGTTRVEVLFDDGERGTRHFGDADRALQPGNPVVEQTHGGWLGFRWRGTAFATSGVFVAEPKHTK
jgi:hypothetical protein